MNIIRKQDVQTAKLNDDKIAKLQSSKIGRWQGAENSNIDHESRLIYYELFWCQKQQISAFVVNHMPSPSIFYIYFPHTWTILY